MTAQIALVGGLAAVGAALSYVPISLLDAADDGSAIALAVAGVAAGGIIAAWRSPWRRFVALVGLAAVGQACALLLVDVSRHSVFEHRLTPGQLFAEPARSAAVALLLLQLAICAILAWRHRVSLARWFREVKWPAALTLLAVLGFSAAVPAVSLLHFLWEASFSFGVSLVALATLVFAALEAPERSLEDRFTRFEARLTLTPGRTADDGSAPVLDGRLGWIAGAWVFVFGCFAGLVVFDGVPHIEDTIAYLFQAKTLALGQIQLPPPPDAPAFEMGHIVNDGASWFGKYFPGWPLVLSIGVRLGAPWMVNALVCASIVAIGYDLVCRLSGVATANVVALLLATSPWLLFMAGTHWSHPTAALWTLVALQGVTRAQESQGVGWAALSGFALGALLLTRPLDAVLIGAVVGLAALGLGGRRLPVAAMVSLGVVGLLVASLMFPYDHALTGNALYPPFTLWSDTQFGAGVDVLGFGRNVGIGIWPHLDPLPGHGLADVILNLNKSLYMTNADLHGWAGGSLLFALIALLWARWKREEAVLLAALAAIVIGQQVYWFNGGPDLGARYWFPIVVPLAFLTARGLQAAAARLGSGTGGGAQRRALLLAAVAVFCATLTFLPWRALTKYYRYRDISRDVIELEAKHQMTGALVFVRSEDDSDYQSAFTWNPVPLEGPGTIYARDVDRESREAVVRAWPARPIFVVGREADEEHMRLLAGPLPAGVTPE